MSKSKSRVSHFSQPLFSKDHNQFTVIMNDVDLSIINSLRRIILAEIPNVGFGFDPHEPRINIKTNTTSLHNEFIRQRLSMVPINIDINKVLDFEEKDYTFRIRSKNLEPEDYFITTGDINVYDKDDKILPKEERDKIFPKNPDYIPLLYLKASANIEEQDGAEIDIEARATKDIAKTHAGFAPVSICAHEFIVNEAEAKKALEKHEKEWYEKNREKMSKRDLEKELKYIRADFQNLTRARFYYKNIYDEPNSILFKLESEYTNFTPEYIIFKGLAIMLGKIIELTEDIEKKKIKIQNVEGATNPNLWEFQIIGEDHTIGNLVQSLFVNHFCRDEDSKRIIYCGYNKGHPLQDAIIVRVETADEKAVKDVREMVIDGLDYIRKNVNKLLIEWLNANKQLEKYEDVKEHI